MPRNNLLTVKFTGYLYLPKDTDDVRALHYFSQRRAGRIQIFDEHNKRMGNKMVAFDNLADMQWVVEQAWRKRAKKTLQTIKKRVI
jgi:hypothetical protein